MLASARQVYRSAHLRNFPGGEEHVGVLDSEGKRRRSSRSGARVEHERVLVERGDRTPEQPQPGRRVPLAARPSIPSGCDG